MAPLPQGEEIPKITLDSMIDFLLTRDQNYIYVYHDPQRCLVTDLCQWLDPRIATSTFDGGPKAWYGEPYNSKHLDLPPCFTYIALGDKKDRNHTYGGALKRAYKEREKGNKK